MLYDLRDPQNVLKPLKCSGRQQSPIFSHLFWSYGIACCVPKYLDSLSPNMGISINVSKQLQCSAIKHDDYANLCGSYMYYQFLNFSKRISFEDFSFVACHLSHVIVVLVEYVCIELETIHLQNGYVLLLQESSIQFWRKNQLMSQKQFILPTLRTPLADCPIF